MVTWPVRALPVLAAMASPTVPEASPLCPDVNAIHRTLVVVVQWHPVNVVTSTVSPFAAEAIVSRVRLNVNVHGAAAWLTARLSEPTRIDPDRATGTGLAATVYGIVASPWPSCAPAIATQAASVVIDQVQSRWVATVTDPWPPADPNVVGAVVTFTSQRSVVGDVSDVSVLLHARVRNAEAERNAVARRSNIRRRIGDTASPEASIPPFPIAVSSSMAADDREHDQALTRDAEPVAVARLANTKARLSEAGRCGGGRFMSPGSGTGIRTPVPWLRTTCPDP